MATKKVYSLSDFSRKKSEEHVVQTPGIQLSASQTARIQAPVKTNSKHETIIVDLNTVVDLSRIDRHVTGIFQELANSLQNKNNELYKLASYDYDSVEEGIVAESHKMRLSEEIDLLKAKLKDYPTYFKEATPLLQKYKELCPDTSKRVVGGEETSIPIEHYDIFQYVVTEFVRIASRFSSQIKVVMNNISVENCQCGGTPYVVDDIATCPDCRKETKLRESSLDSAKCGKSDYYRSETFEEYFDEAQGRRKKPIPPEVYQTISNHCVKHNIQESSLTKSDVLRILKLYKFSDFYKSINLICNVLLGSPLPEIQEYRQRCLERHRLIEEEYMEMRNSENRSNFLYAWYVLRACLHMEGFNARSEDFITLTTREAAIEHNKFMIKICERIRKKQETDSSIKGNWNFDGLR